MFSTLNLDVPRHANGLPFFDQGGALALQLLLLVKQMVGKGAHAHDHGKKQEA
jgi:hypothetical protein